MIYDNLLLTGDVIKPFKVFALHGLYCAYRGVRSPRLSCVFVPDLGGSISFSLWGGMTDVPLMMPRDQHAGLNSNKRPRSGAFNQMYGWEISGSKAAWQWRCNCRYCR